MRVVLICAAAVGLASAARSDPLSDCKGGRTPDVQIAGCSQVITAHPTERAILAMAHVNRANGHVAKRDYKNALADFDAAIEFDPEMPLAYYNRANTLQAI